MCATRAAALLAAQAAAAATQRAALRLRPAAAWRLQATASIHARESRGTRRLIRGCSAGRARRSARALRRVGHRAAGRVRAGQDAPSRSSAAMTPCGPSRRRAVRASRATCRRGAPLGASFGDHAQLIVSNRQATDAHLGLGLRKIWTFA